MDEQMGQASAVQSMDERAGQVPAAREPAVRVQIVDSAFCKRLNGILQKYKAGKARTDQRVIASENWWKLRNASEERKVTEQGKDGGFTAASGWMHNVLTNKHADMVDAYPEPIIRPREVSDGPEARILQSILPCVMEQNDFEEVYSDACWRKVKTGTAVYKTVWQPDKLGGIGDITMTQESILDLFWEPGITDIQQSKYLFHTELVDRDVLESRYPQLVGKLGKTGDSIASKYQYDDAVDTTDKATVVECYYHVLVDGARTLQYVKYVGETVLDATENGPERARGLYDHGLYPYDLDPLFPIEGSPAGYGYIDLCKSAQTEIDLLETAFVKNAMTGAIPRFLMNGEGGVNEDELLDLSKPIIHVAGSLSEQVFRQVDQVGLGGNYISLYDRVISSLRETSGNTESSTGSVTNVQTASGIAALQEASGKLSRDASKSAYRVYRNIVFKVIELIRQFYDMPRQFRILGEYGAEQFVSYSNAKLKEQQIAGQTVNGAPALRLPVFDIRVEPAKKSQYTKASQNEMALSFYNMGFFQPQQAEMAMATLQMMDFDGKDEVMQRIASNAQQYNQMLQWMQLAISLAQKYEPQSAEALSQSAMEQLGVQPTAAGNAGAVNLGSAEKVEPTFMSNARQRSQDASQPGGNS